MAEQIDLPKLYMAISTVVDKTAADAALGAIKSLDLSVNKLAESSKKAQQPLDLLGRPLRDLQRYADDDAKKLTGLAKSIDNLQKSGETLQTFGYSLVQAVRGLEGLQEAFNIQQYADQYIQAVGNTEQVSQDWSRAMYDSQSASVSLGRSMAQALLPSLQFGTALMKDFAAVMEHIPLPVTQVGAALIAIVGGLTAVSIVVEQVSRGFGALLTLPGKLAEAGGTLREVFKGAGSAAEAAGGAAEAIGGVTKGGAEVAGATTAASIRTASATAAAQVEIQAATEAAAMAQDSALAAGADIEEASATAAEVYNATLAAGQAARAAEGAVAGAVQGAEGAAGGAAAAAGAAGGAGIMAGVAGALLPVIGGLAVFGTAAYGAQRAVLALDKSAIPVTTTLGKGATVIADFVGNLVGGKATGDEWANAMANFTGVIDKDTAALNDHAIAVEKAEAAGMTPTQAALAASLQAGQAQAAFEQYTVDTANLQTQFNMQQTDQDLQHKHQLNVQDRDFALSRQREDAQVQVQNANQWRDYYHNFSIQSQNFQRDETKQRDAQQHQIGLDQESFNHQEILTAASQQHELGRQQADFDYETQKSQADLHYQQTIEIRDYNRQQLIDVAAHNLQMQRMAQDQALNLDDLGRQRDALGIVKAQRQNAIDTQRAEQDFQIQQAQAKNQLNLQIMDQQYAFNYQEGIREADFKRQVDIQNAENEYQKGLRADEYKYQHEQQAKEFAYQQGLREADNAYQNQQQSDEIAYQQKTAAADLAARRIVEDANRAEDRKNAEADYQWDKDFSKYQFDEQQAIRAQQFRYQIDQLDAHLTGDYDTQQKWHLTMHNDFVDWLNGLDTAIKNNPLPQFTQNPNVTPPSTSAGGEGVAGAGGANQSGAGTNTWYAGSGSWNPNSRQMGGYASNKGLYDLAEAGNEFVLNAATTSKAESLLGSKLTQTNVLAALLSGRTGGGRISFGDINIHAGSPEEAISQITAQVSERVYEAYRRSSARKLVRKAETKRP